MIFFIVPTEWDFEWGLPRERTRVCAGVGRVLGKSTLFKSGPFPRPARQTRQTCPSRVCLIYYICCVLFHNAIKCLWNDIFNYVSVHQRFFSVRLLWIHYTTFVQCCMYKQCMIASSRGTSNMFNILKWFWTGCKSGSVWFTVWCAGFLWNHL